MTTVVGVQIGCWDDATVKQALGDDVPSVSSSSSSATDGLITVTITPIFTETAQTTVTMGSPTETPSSAGTASSVESSLTSTTLVSSPTEAPPKTVTVTFIPSTFSTVTKSSSSSTPQIITETVTVTLSSSAVSSSTVEVPSSPASTTTSSIVQSTPTDSGLHVIPIETDALGLPDLPGLPGNDDDSGSPFATNTKHFGFTTATNTQAPATVTVTEKDTATVTTTTTDMVTTTATVTG
ncbi:hypothetical protein ABKA04_004561 [Annulohypoxylon sp. FPYF3050]